jgi:hypothetical protein
MTILEAICSRVRIEPVSRDRAYELYGALLSLGVPLVPAREAAASAFAQHPGGMFEDQLRLAAGLVHLDVRGDQPAAGATPHGGRPVSSETKAGLPSRQQEKENPQ